MDQPISLPQGTRWYSGATRGQWLALAAALLGWAFDGFEQGVFPIVARPALIELEGLQEQESIRQDATRTEAEQQQAKEAVDSVVSRWNAVMTLAFLIGASLGGFLFGWIGDRLGRVRAMVLSVLTYAVFTGFCGFAQAAWQIALLRFISAMGMGGEWALGVALVMESWSSHARPVLAGLIGAAANVGFFITGLLGLVLRPTEYWRIILIVCVVPALLTFLLRVFVPESKRWQEAVASGPRARMGDIFVPALRSRSLLGVCLGAIALLATWGGVQWIPLWVSERNKDLLPFAQMASALGAIIGAFCGAVLGARLSRRMGYFTLCVISLAACELLFIGFREHLSPEKSFDVPFLLTVLLVGACSASFYGWLPLYLPELFPTRVRATGQGFCYNFGRTLAAAGVLVTYFGLNLKGNYPLASSYVVLIYLVGMGLVWFIPETRGKPLPE
jgi:MFS family permease